tara:strand:+ start:114 stop:410 length:297 start_codon:yes stop_codon:yes gene_type:complete
MVNKKSARNNNRSCKKPPPKEGKLLTNSDKLIQNVSKNRGEILCKEQKEHIKLGLAFVRKNQESINSGSLVIGFNYKNTHYKDGNNKFKPEVNKSLTN